MFRRAVGPSYGRSRVRGSGARFLRLAAPQSGGWAIRPPPSSRTASPREGRPFQINGKAVLAPCVMVAAPPALTRTVRGSILWRAGRPTRPRGIAGVRSGDRPADPNVEYRGTRRPTGSLGRAACCLFLLPCRSAPKGGQDAGRPGSHGSPHVVTAQSSRVGVRRGPRVSTAAAAEGGLLPTWNDDSVKRRPMIRGCSDDRSSRPRRTRRGPRQWRRVAGPSDARAYEVRAQLPWPRLRQQAVATRGRVLVPPGSAALQHRPTIGAGEPEPGPR